MSSNARNPRIVCFDDYVLDLDTAELSRNGTKTSLQSQPFQILVTLLENPGRLVTREELTKRLWPAGTFVDFDQSLNKAVGRLREALGDDAEKPRYIETLSRRGYRWIVPIKENSLPTVPIVQDQKAIYRSRLMAYGMIIALSAAAIAVGLLLRRRHEGAAIKSLAVLPLENLSGDPTQDYFADGVTDELTTKLGQLGALRVLSRTSAAQYKGARKPLPQIAREMNVDAIVEGSVVRYEDRVRVTARLIQADTDVQLWTQTYEGNLRDIWSLQSQVTTAIAEQVRIKVTPQEQALLKTVRIIDPSSYDDYLQGLYFAQSGTIDGYQKSITYFNQSVAKDAGNAEAYAEMADSYVTLGHMVSLPPQQAFPAARKAAERAVQLDDSSAEAHQASANVKFLYDWDFAGAEREFRRALQLNPNSLSARVAYADYLDAMGRFDDSLAERKRNLQVDPLSVRPLWGLALGYYWAHRYEETLAPARKVVELNPNHWSGHLYLGLALEQLHRFPEAKAELQKAIDVSHNKMFVAFIARDLAMSGDHVGARKILADLESLSRHTYVSPWLPAIVYPDLGDKERAYYWLEKCYQGREHDLVFSLDWPMFDPLRSDSRFHELMLRVGLPLQQ